MSYADYVFVENCDKIIREGISDEGFDVRPKWADGKPAHTKKILYVQNRYQLRKDRFRMSDGYVFRLRSRPNQINSSTLIQNTNYGTCSSER